MYLGILRTAFDKGSIDIYKINSDENCFSWISKYQSLEAQRNKSLNQGM
jgi:hypothetical protein